jgi:hypothetical protein
MAISVGAALGAGAAETEEGSIGALVAPQAKFVQTHDATTHRLLSLKHPLRWLAFQRIKP